MKNPTRFLAQVRRQNTVDSLECTSRSTMQSARQVRPRALAAEVTTCQIMARLLIIDDEPLARENLRIRLRDVEDFVIVGECANGREALAAIREEKPDMVFIDIKMPDMSGFEVLEQVPPEILPVIVFVTAYDRYALEAFRIHALDYLLKPFEDERFDSFETGGFGGISPGKYRLVFESSENHTLDLDCTLQVERGDRYQFVAVPEGIAVTLEGYGADEVDEIDAETSSLCGR